MNSEEGMSLAKMAVTVLLVVLVIGAVVAIVYKAYSWFNSGSDKLGDQVNSIDASSYAQYDDTQISGTDVLTALKTYRDSDIAIFIGNGKDSTSTYATLTNSGTTAVKAYNYCALIATSNTDEVGVPAADGAVVELSLVDGKYKALNGLIWEDTTGYTRRNTNFSVTTTKNSNCYVKQGAQFYAKLVYDGTTDEVCGILFSQYVNASTTP